MASRSGQLTRPAIRLRPVPPLDPPFDDEMLPVAWARGPAGQLALDLAAGSTDARRIVDPAAGPATLPAAALATATPEARRAAYRFLHICLEIVNGYRPANQMRRLTNPSTARIIINQLTTATTRLRGPGRHPNRTQNLVRFRIMRVCEPRPGVAEATAVLGRGTRSWAFAFRLERHHGSWLGTAAELLWARQTATRTTAGPTPSRASGR